MDENQYSYRANGKIRLTISRSYGDTKQFPQKKDGTHNYAAAAQHVVYLFDTAKESREGYKQRRNTSDANQPLADRLNTEFGEYSATASEYEEGSVKVRFKIEETLTEEQARVVLALHKELNAKIASMKEAEKRTNELGRYKMEG